MASPLDLLLTDTSLTPAQQQVLRTALAADPALAAAAAQWQALQDALGAQLAQDRPTDAVLVTYALATCGQEALLTDAEQAALTAAHSSLSGALAAHPALQDIVHRIQADAALFEQLWAQHLPAASRAPRPPVPPAADRTARSGRTAAPVQRWAWRLGALAAVLGFVTLMALLIQRDQSQVIVQVPDGETRVVALADGSTARLLGGTTLRYTDPAAAAVFDRRVWLEGRAFFDVAHQAERFVVETPTAEVTVLGTRFGVVADAHLAEVVLVTGRVALAPRGVPGQRVMLAPGQMSRVAAGALASTPSPVAVAEALAWTELFFFRAEPVPAIAARLSAHYGVAVTVDPALATAAVTGTFAPEQPLAEILATVAAALGAEVRPQAEGGFLLVPTA